MPSRLACLVALLKLAWICCVRLVVKGLEALLVGLARFETLRLGCAREQNAVTEEATQRVIVVV